MSDTSLVFAGRDRAVLPALPAGVRPPTRIYLGDLVYKVSAPRVPLPPIVNVAKMVLNWATTAGRFAKNVLHVLFPAGATVSDPAQLLSLANHAMTVLASPANIPAVIGPPWTLESVTCHDLGGTTAQATSTVTAIPGTAAAQALPPGNAVCWSWQVATSYRGGKPRTYMPGIPTNAIYTGGSAQLSTTYALAVQAVAGTFMASMNSFTTAGSGNMSLGMVSYHHGHAVRPTPLFYPFEAVNVHERIDSQRRRNGKEATYPEVP